MITPIRCTLLMAAVVTPGVFHLENWRQPTVAELASSQDWRKGCADGRCLDVRADFDGDGRPDEAMLAIGKQDSRVAVILMRAGDKPTVLTTLPEGAIDYMGLTVREAGVYVTACGKGYRACAKGDPAKLTISLPAIALFKTESGESLFYWHAQSRTFRRVWLSD